MIDLESAVLTNAAGMVKTEEQALALLEVPTLTRITIGSVKLRPWPGNSGEVYYYHPVTKTAWNSKGLDSPGLDALLVWLPGFYEKCKAVGKQLAVSIAGSSPEEYAHMAGVLAPFCDLIEFNAGCGNVWGEGGQKPIPSYHPELFHRCLQVVGGAINNKHMLSVKLSPVTTPFILPLAGVLRSYPFIVEAICCNTKILQEGTREDGSPALAFKEPGGTEVRHQGGMSGKPLKEESMRVLNDLIGLVPRIRFIGCGGIDSGRDMIDYMEHGTAGVAIGTEFFQNGPRTFERVITEASDILETA